MAASRPVRRWAAPALAFASAVVVALLAIATNVATGLIPESWMWAHDPWLMWSLVAGLTVLGSALAAWIARTGSPSSIGSTTTIRAEGAGSAAVAGGSGTTIVAGDGATISVPSVPPPLVASSSGQVVHGEIPGRPVAWQSREEVDALVAAVVSGPGVTVVCATGQRGVGKSQAAAAVARHVATELGWTLVAWVNGESEQALVAGLEPVARALGAADPDGDSYRSAELLRDRLRTRTAPGLLVFDNAESPDRVRRWLPGVGATRVVVTSTDRSMAALGTVVEIDTYSRERSVSYLNERTGLDEPDAADRVADELGDLPLALTQAASTIVLRDRSYARYLARLADTDVDAALVRRDDDPYPRGAAAAILLSIEALESGSRHAATARSALEVIALLDPAGTDRDQLGALLSRRLWPPTWGILAPGPVEEPIERAVAASVLTWAQIGGRSVVMHRLVARVVRERAARDDTMILTLHHLIARISEHLVPPREEGWFRRSDQLDQAAGHARSLWGHLYRDEISQGSGNATAAPRRLRLFGWAMRHLDMEAHRGANLVGSALRYLNDTGQHRAAIALGADLRGQIVQLVGEDHPSTLALSNNLAAAYNEAGRFEEASSLHEDTLARRRRLLGDDHRDTLTSASNLAATFAGDGRLEEALSLHEDTLARRRRLLGDDHPDTLTSANNLAASYEEAGRLDGVVSLLEDTLARRRRVVGHDHPATLNSANNLATAYEKVGRHDEGLALYQETLVSRRRVLGDDHPHTLTSANNLATSYLRDGRREDALSLLEDSLARRRRLLGDSHPDTVIARRNLAAARAQGSRAQGSRAQRPTKGPGARRRR